MSINYFDFERGDTARAWMAIRLVVLQNYTLVKKKKIILLVDR